MEENTTVNADPSSATVENVSSPDTQVGTVTSPSTEGSSETPESSQERNWKEVRTKLADYELQNRILQEKLDTVNQMIEAGQNIQQNLNAPPPDPETEFINKVKGEVQKDLQIKQAEADFKKELESVVKNEGLTPEEKNKLLNYCLEHQLPYPEDAFVKCFKDKVYAKIEKEVTAKLTKTKEVDMGSVRATGSLPAVEGKDLSREDLIKRVQKVMDDEKLANKD